MMESTLTGATKPEPRKLSSPLSNGMLGMIIFVAMELMFFSGFISAFTITKAGAPAGMWPPPNQPLLPASQTAVNTVVLLLSGVLLFVSSRKPVARATRLWWTAWALGAAFVVLQGREWLSLFAQGMTLTSSSLGAFFYLIVGAHGLHAVGALIGMVWVGLKLQSGKATKGMLDAAQVFWYFVVLLWPVIYSRVYF